MSARKWPFILFALGFAYLVKRYYSHADAESLRWILAPTAWLVGSIFGRSFSFEPGYGYLSRDLHFAIVPACAGINFWVIAVGAFVSGVVPRLTTLALQVRWLVVGTFAALGVTLLANMVRISIAVWLHLHPLNVDHAQLHRIEGSLVYLVFLFVFYAASEARAKKVAT